MDFITALQSSASSLSDGDVHFIELLGLVSRLTDPGGRRKAALDLASYLGGEELLIFTKDSEVNQLLPVAGFAQTLPSSRPWRSFLAETVECGLHRGTLPFPRRDRVCPAIGVAIDDSAVLVLLGGQPQLSALVAVAMLLPLLTAVFRGEQAALAAAGHAAVAQQAADQAQALARSLDTARRELQAALNVAQDERKRATFLAEAGTVLAGSLDYERTIVDLARLVIPCLADAFSVDLAEEDGAVRRLITAFANDTNDVTVQVGDPDPAWAVATAYRSDDLIGSGIPEVLNVASEVQQAAASVSDEQRVLLERAGVAELIGVPLLIRGRPIGALTLLLTTRGRRFTARDLTLAEELGRRVALAIENTRLFREAQEAVAIRDQFLSIAAHELKTPVTTLVGYAQLLQRRMERDGLSGSHSLRAVIALQQQARRLHRLSLALLDFSHLQARQLSLELGVVNLDVIIPCLAVELQAQFERHTLVVERDSEGLTVLGDPLRIEQVFYNLVVNAIKYSLDGGVITIHLARREDYACISISDHGIGIPLEAQAQLFSRFYRASNVQAHKISGMGLGLYIVKEIVALHGGRVEVESAEGAGSTFRVLLPLHQQA